MDRYQEYLSAVKDGIKVTVEATVVDDFTRGGYFVRGTVHKKLSAWYHFWQGADVQELSMGPYSTFGEACGQLAQVMRNHSNNLSDGSRFEHVVSSGSGRSHNS